MLIPILLNWYLNPYHTPIAVAKIKGFFEEQNIDPCIIEPTNPSDVTKIVGEGHVPIALKAMVHCFAARDRGYPITAIGTLLDEPPTGLICPIERNIQSISDIKGKTLGYVGEFGKVMIDDLARNADLSTDSYKTVRVGMDAATAIINGQVDAAIGLSCMQQIEVEEAGIPTHLFRIDEAANLGCCCFCSIVIITQQQTIHSHSEMLSGFMQAVCQGLEFTREDPDEAFHCLTQCKRSLDTPLFKKIFHHTLPFFSRDGLNQERDWLKVARYANRLGICNANLTDATYYTNEIVCTTVTGE